MMCSSRSANHMAIVKRLSINQFFVLVLTILSVVHTAQGQAGCADTLAQNFEETATIEDGSCMYECSNLATHYGLHNPTCIFAPFVVESCDPVADCTAGYVQGTALSPSSTCTTSGCTLTAASAEVLPVVEACTVIDASNANDADTCDAVDISGSDASVDQTSCEGAGGGGKCTYTSAISYAPAIDESCTAIVDCSIGYVPGTVDSPSSSCTTAGCALTTGTIDVIRVATHEIETSTIPSRNVIYVPAGENWIFHGYTLADGSVPDVGAHIEIAHGANVVMRMVAISNKDARIQDAVDCSAEESCSATLLDTPESCVDTDSSGDDCSGFIPGNPTSCGSCDYEAATDHASLCEAVDISGGDAIADRTACETAGGAGTCTYVADPQCSNPDTDVGRPCSEIYRSRRYAKSVCGVVYADRATLTMEFVHMIGNGHPDGSLSAAEQAAGQVLSNPYGPSINTHDTDIVMRNCRFADSWAEHGGSSYFWNDHRATTILIEDTVYEDNESYDAGAIHTGLPHQSNDLTFRATRFLRNFANAHGGGALILYNTWTKMEDCLLDSNWSERDTDGGAIEMQVGTILELVHTQFTGNHASRNGGSIFMRGGAQLTSQFSSFTGGSAAASAGAIYANDNDVVILQSSSFNANAAAQNGGSIYASGASVEANSCDFADDTATGLGGAVFASEGSAVVLQSTTLSGAEAASGGAVYSSESNVTVSSCQIESCRAASSGGAIVSIAKETKPVLTIANSTFMSNIAPFKGGALYTKQTNVIVRETEFSANSATAVKAWDVQGACTVLDECVQSPNYPEAYGNFEDCNISPRLAGTLSCNEFDTVRGWDFLYVDGKKYSGTGQETTGAFPLPDGSFHSYDANAPPYCWDNGLEWNWQNLPCEQAFNKRNRGYDANPEMDESCICIRPSQDNALLYYDGPSSASECAAVMCQNGRGEFIFSQCFFNPDGVTVSSHADLIAGNYPNVDSVGTVDQGAADSMFTTLTSSTDRMCAEAPELGCPAVSINTDSEIVWDSSGDASTAQGWEVCVEPTDPSITIGRSEGGAIYAESGELTIAASSFAHTSDAVLSQVGHALFVKAVETWKISNTAFHGFTQDTVYTMGMPVSSCTEYPCAAGEQCAYTEYSLSCSPCSANLVSDGIRCTACPAGTGPSNDLSVCVQCEAGKYSSDGTCMPCSAGLVPNVGQTGCQECGSRLTSSNGSDCTCDDGYRNGTQQLIVCFADGYEEDYKQRSVSVHTATKTSGQECEECPADAMQTGCMDCVAGQEPTLRPGYTVPQLPGSSRRSLQDQEGPVVFAVRCHYDLDVAVSRCPGDVDHPGQCATGYDGYMCGQCSDSWGKSGSGRICEPCEGAGYNGASLFTLLGVIAGLVLSLVVLSKVWKAFPLKHLARCAFQPMRILITYSQVTSQLGDVLDFQYPGLFGDVIDALRPIMDLWGLLFRALGPSECFGLRGFTSRWLLRVVGLPAVLSFCVLLYYAYDRYANAPDKARIRAKGNLFFAVFFCYPTICIVSFATFICKSLTPTDSVLEADDTILCQDPGHRGLQAVSAVVVAVVAFGLPVLFGLILLRAAHNYENEFAAQNMEAAKLLAKEVDSDQATAEYVMRDITIGRDYSFLMDAYHPRFLYWEALDMTRKLALVGLVLLVGRGTIAQLSVAIVLSFGFFALQMLSWPYKVTQDNIFRASTEAHVFIVITTALVLKNDAALQWEAVQVEAYDYILFISFILLVPCGAVVATVSKLRHVQAVLAKHSVTTDILERRKLTFHLQALGLADDADKQDLKRFIDGWMVHKEHACFLSHFKNESAAEARILKSELVRGLRVAEQQIFLDSDNLTDLRTLLDSVIASDAIVLLLTEGVLSRPWCLLELHAAASNNVPIIVATVSNSFAADVDRIMSCLDDLPAYLSVHNPEAEETLKAHGQSASTIGLAIMKGLSTHDALMFDPHQNSEVLKKQVEQIAAALVQTTCPENAPLLANLNKEEAKDKWPDIPQKYAVYIVNETGTSVGEAASHIQFWLQHRTELQPERVVISSTSVAAGVTDVDVVAQQTHAVLFIQTIASLREASCLVKLYTAATNGVPIVPVLLTSTSKDHVEYDFKAAASHLANLSTTLSKDASTAVSSATGVATDRVGLTLEVILSNVISKSFALDGSVGDRDAQMSMIEQALRTAHVRGSYPIEEGAPEIKTAHP